MEEENVPPIDPDFEPQSRPRSCTWPLPRPDISAVKTGGTDGSESAAGTPPTEEDKHDPQPTTSEPDKVAVTEGGVLTGVGGATPRKGTSRRNAWGNQSYAELISQAIENSPEKRLTLAQIYDWMVKTVPYFKDKGDSNSSAGWKNSIRHNLSLHNKFLRVHNESTGKSSWWMLNPEGGKTGKAPRRRAASMDNSSKLLKSRMRAKQTKKQAGASGIGGSAVAMQGEGVSGTSGADSPGSQSQFGKWGVNSSSPSSRGSLDDPDMWTSFRPRTSSNASTLSGRLSPIATGQEDEEELPEDALLAGYSTGNLPPTLTETLMEELDLIDGLTLMTGPQGGASPSTAPPAPPQPLPSASTLLPRGSSFPSFRRLASSKASPGSTPPGSNTSGRSSTSPSNFGNSLFSPLSGPGSHGGFSPHVPSSLEALLTSDSPPPSEVMMTQMDPLMPSQGGLLGLGGSLSSNQTKPSQMMLSKSIDTSAVGQMSLQNQPQLQHSQMSFAMMHSGMNHEPPQLSTVKTQHHVPGLLQHGAVPSPGGNGGMQGLCQFSTPPCFIPLQDRLPTDLDIEMFTENLDCNVEDIINSDLMDGDLVDFNFDPIIMGGQGYTGPATTQSSSHNWVPS
ncbi:forkhead box protein O4 [Triplophysa dalaica]|uniref:forkhead box protein O4 n=1 Tax=Triplophysa dalaica TaxID=1582913 RepID=UPI0024DF89CC|nr:forkhead box protein O4 [Triplophysa dalaica]XP_056625484.1 forkhead box protein O4 [Triplophysa dalaica]